jgi:hypothetical protein
MADAAKPPNHLRLRIIAAMVIFAIGLGWWIWPRGDGRFVGRWVDVSDPGVTMDFRSTGRAYLETRRPPPYVNVRLRTVWMFDGQAIRVGKASKPSTMSGYFWTAWNSLTGESGISHEVKYEVDRIEPARLWLTQMALGRNGESVPVRFEFKRVEE